MNDARTIYLDYAATTPVDEAVAAAMAHCLGRDGVYGNAASLMHEPGRRAAAAVDAARAELAALIGARPGELVFTSGATEADNLAVIGAARYFADRGRHLVTTRIEHKAVLDAARRLERDGWEVTWLEPDAEGRIDPASVGAALRDDTVLAAVMWVNNETGVVNDVEAIGRLCRERGVLFHVDAAQAVGKLAIDLARLPVDFLALTAHKFYGPKGVGALYIADRPGVQVQPLLYGGGQERGLRPGTLPVHQIVGLGAAAARAREELPAERARLAALRDRLSAGLTAMDGVLVNGGGAERIPGIVNVSVAGVDGESLFASLEPLAVASGSACNTTSGEPSYVLRALGRDDRLAGASVRFSLGRYTTEDEVDRALDIFTAAVHRLRRIAAPLGGRAA
ncbi:cysteine desulfurase family protein [Lentisalinibacter orientalis]|uniref:cysteine desulfurase family protein n=1 Tax=Lentisalinibacter orientalis TaxID=2992241 RepID=UPI0038631390